MVETISAPWMGGLLYIGLASCCNWLFTATACFSSSHRTLQVCSTISWEDYVKTSKIIDRKEPDFFLFFSLFFFKIGSWYALWETIVRPCFLSQWDNLWSIRVTPTFHTIDMAPSGPHRQSTQLSCMDGSQMRVSTNLYLLPLLVLWMPLIMQHREKEDWYKWCWLVRSCTFRNV